MSSAHQKIPINFENGRAKLVKAIRLNKLDKPNEKFRQNANDIENNQASENEKFGVILTQAEKMLKSHSFNQNQYEHLVQTVLSMNDKQKLKKVESRESLQLKDVTAPIKDDDKNSTVGVKLNHYRIPKKFKSNTTTNTDASKLYSYARSPLEEKEEVNINVISRFEKPKVIEKKHSKWEDRNKSQANTKQNRTSQRVVLKAKRPSSNRRYNNIHQYATSFHSHQPLVDSAASAFRLKPLGVRGSWIHQSGSGYQPNRPTNFSNQMQLNGCSASPPLQQPILTGLTANNSIRSPQTHEYVLPTNISSNLAPNVTPSTNVLGEINIDELFKKLVSSGLIDNNLTTKKAEINSTNAAQNINTTKPEATTTLKAPKTDEISSETESFNDKIRCSVVSSNFFPTLPLKTNALAKNNVDEIFKNLKETVKDSYKPEKTLQESVISSLYSGTQCSNCSLRFSSEESAKYRQHLDWHFRQNRGERDSTRKAHIRQWYLPVNNWHQYIENEDSEEREKIISGAQQNNASNEHESLEPSCPAGPDHVERLCDICEEKFEQFYHEDLEEWHLRKALRVEDKIYHPICYQDYKASLNLQAMPKNNAQSNSNDDEIIKNEKDNSKDAMIKIEKIKKASDMTIATMIPNEEPSIIEIDDDDDDEEYKTTDLKNNNVDESVLEVRVQDPNILFTDLDIYEEKDLSVLDEKIKEDIKDDEFKDALSTDSPLTVGREHLSSVNKFNKAKAAKIVNEVKQNSALSENSNRIAIDGSFSAEKAVNKTKINITRNTSSAPMSSSTNAYAASTIPVLCTGGVRPSSNPANNITVTGSYDNYYKPQYHRQHYHHHRQQYMPAFPTSRSAGNFRRHHNF